MKLDTQRQVDQAEKILRLVWLIVFGAVLFSVLTVTPLVQRVTPDAWDWTAWILPVVVDAAVVIVVRVDEIVARLDGRPGGWPALLRWLTGGMTLLLNVGDSMLKGDWVGVGVHAVAPVLLIVTAEAAIGWRRAINKALARIDREQAAERERLARERREQEDRARADREAREQAQAAERERQRQAEERLREQARLDREREREHQARLAREEREHQAQVERERREEEARLRKEEQDRADRLRREAEERQEREQKDREAAQRAERERKAAEARRTAAPAVSASVSAPRPTVSASVSTPPAEPAHEPQAAQKMPESKARAAVAEGLREGRSQRQLVALTGWSAGWVAKQAQALTKTEQEQQPKEGALV
ncbi:hypothetical protein ABZ135_37940 [Streptomyces sp. NPDC006339]|uniref:hypothetical protein n=1 Tax=Streptomyces sp. NPDC006339 TaxID=3156755 RepID=UPI0033AD107F